MGAIRFNFVATTYRNRVKELVEELNRLLKDYGPIEYVEGLPLNSVAYGWLSGDPVSASRRLFEETNRDPWSVRRVLKFYPIQVNCSASREDISRALETLTGGEPVNASVEVETRLSSIRWGELVNVIRPYVKGSIFKKSEAVLVVEVLMDVCGISILNKADIFRALDAKLAGSYFP